MSNIVAALMQDSYTLESTQVSGCVPNIALLVSQLKPCQIRY